MADEELRAIDADHFWIGEVMVDLVQLRHETESLNTQANASQWWDVHERNRVAGNLGRYAAALAKGEHQDKWPCWAEYIRKNLLTANQHGLHTGYVSKEER